MLLLHRNMTLLALFIIDDKAAVLCVPLNSSWASLCLTDNKVQSCVLNAADELDLLTKYEVTYKRTRLQIIDDTLQAAEQHQDIHLVATANYTRATVMLHKG